VVLAQVATVVRGLGHYEHYAGSPVPKQTVRTPWATSSVRIGKRDCGELAVYTSAQPFVAKRSVSLCQRLGHEVLGVAWDVVSYWFHFLSLLFGLSFHAALAIVSQALVLYLHQDGGEAALGLPSSSSTPAIAILREHISHTPTVWRSHARSSSILATWWSMLLVWHSSPTAPARPNPVWVYDFHHLLAFALIAPATVQCSGYIGSDRSLPRS
jgi:hypothetical protein